jgi:hypothetical protein
VRRLPSAADGRLRGIPGLAGAVVCAFFVVGASPAWAGSAFTTVLGLPGALVVGQTGVPASITLSNGSTGAQMAQNVTVSAITLVATCGTQAISTGDCPLTAVDPGLLRLSASGVGEAGTGCAGGTFAIGILDAIEGKYLISPGAPVILGPVGGPDGVCIVDFTVDVLRPPTQDSNPSLAGLQTAATVFAVGVGADGLSSGGFATSETTITGTGLPVVTPLAPTPTPTPTGTITPEAGPRVTAPVAGQAASLEAASTPAPRPRPAVRCVVPQLKGRTLARATHALHVAHCAVNVRRRPNSHHRGAARVAAQHPRSGSVSAAGTRVTVTLDGAR